MKNACVLVLGNASCSPRTVAHAEQLGELDYYVKLYGYSEMPSNISKRIKFSRIPNWTQFTFVYPRIFQLIFKCKFAQKFLCDKRFFHITVSKAFADDLKKRFNIPTQVIYDKPRIEISSTSPERAHDIITKLSKVHPEFLDQDNSIRRTILTEITTGKRGLFHQFRSDRPALLISSCSWTIDDNIDSLLEALEMYDQLSLSKKGMKKILFCITGKGPQKIYYKKIFEERKFRMSKVVLPWVDNADYFDFIGAADLGVCLHNSSSGLDLPMKVVDMHTKAVPVIALKYPCIGELIQDDVNGFVFETPNQLATKIDFLLNDEKGICELESVKTFLIHQYDNDDASWAQEWKKLKIN